MPFVKQLNKDFFINNDEIVLSEEYIKANKWRFKKITGSRIGSILNCNEYTTDLKTWAIMVGIYQDKMDETLAYVGNTIEPKLRIYAEKFLNTNYKFYEPAQVKWDVFTDNKIFGGIPDGEPTDEFGNIDYHNKKMLEIKTTSIDSFEYKKENGSMVMKKDKNGAPIVKKKDGKLEKWFDANGKVELPREYQLQLGLYMYLRNITNGVFVVGFLTRDDYVHPEKYDIETSLIKVIDFHINLEEFEKVIKICKSWYENYIEKGISPKIKSKDKTWLEEELGSYDK